jgi:hypothetical protein
VKLLVRLHRSIMSNEEDDDEVAGFILCRGPQTNGWSHFEVT